MKGLATIYAALALALALVAVGAWPAAVDAQSLPLGFTDTTVVSGLTNPTNFARLPDGRLLITEKAGLVRVLKNGALLATPFVDLRGQVNDYWDHGLLGIAIDQNFSINGYVYLLYTYENDANDYSGPKSGRMIRVTASGDVAVTGSAVTILGTTVGAGCLNFPVGTDCIPSENPSHSVGNIRVASDGTLFVTLGDASSFNVVDTDALRAQNVDWLAGKLLHITTSGQGISTNPFWNGTASANRSKVYAYGMRNPFRFALHPASGLPFLGDVGWGEWEEVNIANTAAASVNLGWPCYEGFLHQSGYEPLSQCQSLYALGTSAVQMPTIAYYHNTGGSSAVVGGTFYTGTSFPAQYQGAYFYSDYAVGFIRYFQVNSSGAKSGPLLGFGANLGSIGPVYLDTDGTDLYYVAIVPGEIHRISYTPPASNVSYLSDRDWTSMTNGLGPVERDQSVYDSGTFDGRVITMKGVGYAKGLGAASPSDVRYALGGVCSSFQATIGIDDEVGSTGTVVFQVWLDGVKAYDSGTMTSSTAVKAVNVSVSGKNELRLVVTDAGDGSTGDHADWASARVTCGADTTPPTVVSTSPASGAAGVPVSANVTATFSEAIDPTTLTTSTFKVTPQGSTTAVAAVVSYNATSATTTLDPSASLAASTTYTATIKGGSTGVKDVAGNALAADKVWSFTTAASGSTTYLSDMTWTSATNGYGPVERDTSNGEDLAGDGHPITLNGVVYAKGLGVHATADVRYALNAGCTLFTSVIGVDDEVGSNGTVVFQVWTDGALRYDSGVLTGSSASGNVSIDVTGVNELRLLVTPWTDGSDYDHADWADAQVTCGGTTDTTPPTVVSTSPAAGATGVAVTTTVSATFSEAMTASTLTTSTVTLVPQGSTTPVAATVTYDATSRTATLHPTASLAAATTYTATVKGGSGGAKDLAGNALASDKVWTFTSGSSTTSTRYLSDMTWTSATNGYGPVELDTSNGEDLAGDGNPITLNGVVYAKGLGVHATSDIRYALNGTCTLFKAVVGVDDEVGANGTVVFQVWTDGTLRYDSGVMTGSMPGANVSVDTTGVTELRLLVGPSTDGSDYDHADWANAQVTCATSGNQAPTARITAPAASLTFKVGDVINYSGTGTDPEDGTLSGSSLTWNIVLYHCPGTSCHTHPFLSTTGTSGSFTVPDHGDGMYFQINLTATDSGGLTSIASVNIYPQTSQLTLDTSPTGLTVVYGGTTYTAPVTFTPVVGSTHTIYSTSPQGLLSFIQWSDGGAQQHNIVTGATNATYVATFRDITPPTVTSTTPANGATGVSVKVKPAAVFSEPLDATTVTTANAWMVRAGTTTPIAATVSYNATAKSISIRPASSLQSATTFTVTIRGGTGGVTDAAGNALTANAVWSFTTH